MPRFFLAPRGKLVGASSHCSPARLVLSVFFLLVRFVFYSYLLVSRWDEEDALGSQERRRACLTMGAPPRPNGLKRVALELQLSQVKVGGFFFERRKDWRPFMISP